MIFFSFLVLNKKFQKLFMYVHDSLSPPLQYPGLEPVLDELLPKKSALVVAKWFVILLVPSNFFNDNRVIKAKSLVT